MQCSHSLYKEEISSLKESLKYANGLLDQKKRESDKIKTNVVSMLMDNKDTSMMIEILNEIKASMEQIDKDISGYEIRLNEVSSIKDGLKKQYNQIVDWADIYDTADNETKKMIVAGVVDKVCLYKGYVVQIELKIDRMQYEEGLVFGDEEIEQPLRRIV